MDGLMPVGPRAFHSARLTVAIPTAVPERMRAGMREILSLEVPPEDRRQGLATQLMRRTMQEADEAGLVLLIHVKPYDENGIVDVDQLQSFYQRFGFARIQEQPAVLMARPPIRVTVRVDHLSLRRAVHEALH